MSPLRSARPSSTDDLAHPVVLAATLALLANDHLLKGAGLLPAIVTGKLSDAAGLFLFPLVATAVTRALALTGRRDRREIALVVAIGIAFAVTKLFQGPSRALAQAGLVLVADPTDLVAALPALGAALLWIRRRSFERRPWGELARRGIMAVSALACVATSPMPYPRLYPVWEVATATPEAGKVAAADLGLGCARGRLWVAKTGKEGIGIVVQARATESCRLALRSARLRLGRDRYVQPRSLPSPAVAASGQDANLYLPFAFDEQAAWNDGLRDGALEIAFETDAGPSTLTILLGHHLYAWDMRDRREQR